MRTHVRPVVFLALLGVFTAVVQSQEGGNGSQGGNDGPGTNILLFAEGSPSPTTGGVSVGITIQPTTGYTCTSVTISCIDLNGNTLATMKIPNPGASVNQTFDGLGSGVDVNVVVNSVFQNGSQFAYPFLQANVTTK
jgi:hypothetical protein